jgi:hypothetical protein
MTSESSKTSGVRAAETPRQERSQGGQPQARDSGDSNESQSGQPQNEKGAAKATEENDLTTGHSTPSDGGADNAKP